MNEQAEPTLYNACPDCQGYGAIQLPSTVIPSPFGRITYPEKVVGCPSCKATGFML